MKIVTLKTRPYEKSDLLSGINSVIADYLNRKRKIFTTKNQKLNKNLKNLKTKKYFVNFVKFPFLNFQKNYKNVVIANGT